MLCKNDIEQLWYQHYTEMHSLAVAMLHDSEEARDVVSNVFARLLDGYEGSSVNRSYLLMSVKSACLNRISHLKVKERASRLLPLDDAEEQKDHACDEKLAEDMWKFINSELTERTRDIVCRRYAGNMSCEEIAREDGISRQAVHKHVLQALRRLQDHFGRYSHEGL
ncbi:MAG: sigma-70 family RNA polymerase sigma factor [Bacteroidales bacterium]|nr:sigma-70 family RNA polymerase sigma factor [Bacteroidales bacterium]MCM1146361.1 sigma-70 family RNA polymerase sigma factor [Bacteroidales bacterium]MCM1205201.1 sigma-70 family RNA polymerase sigma factor [Bacillota bacterium]MCM1509714.1 sigma-70 family RNA polymerase sigma factor [Clostridium sp.]